jgi:hypothetical protein
MRASWPERMTAHQLRQSNQPAEGHTRRAAFRPNARVRGRSLRCPVYVDSGLVELRPTGFQRPQSRARSWSPSIMRHPAYRLRERRSALARLPLDHGPSHRPLICAGRPTGFASGLSIKRRAS